jgi:hypothetical protein
LYVVTSVEDVFAVGDCGVDAGAAVDEVDFAVVYDDQVRAAVAVDVVLAGAGFDGVSSRAGGPAGAGAST